MPALLRGEVRTTTYEQYVAVSTLGGKEVPLDEAEQRLVERLPAEGAELDGDDARLAGRLLAEGVLVGEAEPTLLAREERLVREEWNGYAALYHFAGRWRGVDAGPASAGDPALDEFLERYGPPPPHVAARRDGASVVPLPPGEPEGALAELLRARRTTREFVRAEPLPLERLSLLLRSVWGIHGLEQVADGVVTVKKTSPSGGGLHPVEVYPLATNVEGIAPGLYHYRPDEHALELRTELRPEEARELAALAVAGQAYFADADVLFLMTARFYRSFWKYRGHPRAYAVLLMDAAHLSQTFYLVCTQLGLGAFVTAAINGADVEERLGLDGYEEGALAICGCGTPGSGEAGLEPAFRPHVPG